MTTNTQVDAATLSALIASIERLTLALDRHVNHCPGWPGSEPFVPPSEEDLSLDPTLLNTGRHPSVIAARLAEFGSDLTGPWYVVTSGREPGVYKHRSAIEFFLV
ncbi:hypothetical protein CVT25_008236 [Psilocybe cyanescens]|uniref:Uncharacterized protein n=1 Tax=Psilocybe cyanescens TaxID=93625 RepID=A0A409XGC0_PSICY|nr:hypothetical protein CVT25_008236 [Psilocybe cyanescens]